MTKRPNIKNRISLGVSQKKQDATMARLTAKKKPARPQRAVKAASDVPWYSGRKIFVYAEDLRVGDVIELHASREWMAGHWQNEICRGPVLSVDRDTQSAYSKTLVMVQNLEFDGPGASTQQHSLSNMSHIRVIP